jgi:hypothetical protein
MSKIRIENFGEENEKVFIDNQEISRSEGPFLWVFSQLDWIKGIELKLLKQRIQQLENELATLKS